MGMRTDSEFTFSASQEQNGATDQGFPADRLYKPIDDLSNKFCANFGASYNSRISIHACLPCTALTKHGRDRISTAQIRSILGGTV